MEQKAYTFTKNIEGGLGFNLESYNMQLPPKHFSIPYNVKSIIVPFPYALGLFISEGAMDQYRMGCFTINDYESLAAAAAEIGLIPDEEAKPLLIKDIQAMVDDGDKAKIEKLLNSGNELAIDTLVTYVNSHLDSVSNGIIKLIEIARGVELEVE